MHFILLLNHTHTHTHTFPKPAAGRSWVLLFPNFSRKPRQHSVLPKSDNVFWGLWAVEKQCHWSGTHIHTHPQPPSWMTTSESLGHLQQVPPPCTSLFRGRRRFGRCCGLLQRQRTNPNLMVDSSMVPPSSTMVAMMMTMVAMMTVGLWVNSADENFPQIHGADNSN